MSKEKQKVDRSAFNETPNKEEIDWIEDRLLEIFSYDRLKDCDINYLHNREFEVENQIDRFKMVFPRSDGPEGLSRAWAAQDTEERKHSLTHQELTRLQLLRMETRMEIHRAYGHRIQLKRELRGKLANAFADGLGKIAGALSKL